MKKVPVLEGRVGQAPSKQSSNSLKTSIIIELKIIEGRQNNSACIEKTKKKEKAQKLDGKTISRSFFLVNQTINQFQLHFNAEKQKEMMYKN